MRDGDIDAFPRPMIGSPETGTVDFGASGMTLRDWFAGRVVTGLLAHPGLIGEIGTEGIVRDAYYIADSLLEQRSK